MYTLAGLAPIELQVALANDAVMVMGSLTLNVDGVMVTCADIDSAHRKKPHPKNSFSYSVYLCEKRAVYNTALFFGFNKILYGVAVIYRYSLSVCASPEQCHNLLYWADYAVPAPQARWLAMKPCSGIWNIRQKRPPKSEVPGLLPDISLTKSDFRSRGI
jgi:hypothetical protein